MRDGTRKFFGMAARGVTASLGAILLAGCASPVDNVFRPVPAMFVPTKNFAITLPRADRTVSPDFKTGGREVPGEATPGENRGTWRVVAFDQNEQPEVIGRGNFSLSSLSLALKRLVYSDPSTRNALYLSVDISDVIRGDAIETKESRDAFMRLVMSISDRNFQTYVSRSAAYGRYRKLYGGLLRDGATAGSGIAAFFSPFTSLGLSLANVSNAAGTIDSGIDKQLLGDFAIEILHTSAIEQRMRFRRYLAGKMGKTLDEYPFLQALDDLQTYDQCGNLLTVLRRKKSEAGAELQKLEQEAYPGMFPDEKTKNP